MSKGKKLVIGNWKMNPQSLAEAKKIFNGVKKHAPKMKKVTTVVCPPFVHLTPLAKSYSGKSVFFGSQNIFTEESGAHTGEISASQARDAGATYTIIGHSERRANGETDEEVRIKVRRALTTKLAPVVCVGESERDTHGEYLSFLRKQLQSAFKGVKPTEVTKITIAYEPIWAIGKTGKDAITPQKLHETTLYIRRVLIELYSKKIALSMKVLYGGSVKPNNAEELLREGDITGFLVGGASLDAESFNKIITIANEG